MSIDNLKSLVAKKGGLAKSNRFNIIFTPPKQSLLNLNPEVLVGSLVSGNFSVKNLINDPRDISLLCQSATLPGRQITTIDYIAEKQNVPIPYTAIDEDVSVKFLLTNDYYMKILFDNWLNSILDMNVYQIGYKKDFAVDVIIQQINEKNIPVYGVKLINAFPTTVSGVELDNGAENSVSELTVTFSYDKYIPEGPGSSTLSALTSAASILT
jgi:hypothetical protein